MKKRMIALALAAAMLSSLTGCSNSSNTAGTKEDQTTSAASEQTETESQSESATESGSVLTPGTYTATKTGYQGEVTVEVTVDETSILSVEVIEITDHPYTVTDLPVRQIPAAIVENQSYNVDSVTGATFTSFAIRNAVEDCLEQAGDSSAFSAAVEKKAGEAIEDADVDILVLGGGGSGSMAAIAAYNQNMDDTASGLSVMLVEKQAFLGGSTGVAGGGYIHYEGDLDEAFQTELAQLQPYSELPVNEELLKNEIGIMEDTNVRLQSLGMPIMDQGYFYMFGGPDAGEMDHDHWMGQNLTNFLNSYLPTTEIDVRVNTRAVALLTDENGAVTGATLEHDGVRYNVHAKKVILATGGFAQNRDLIEQYAPDYVGAVPFCMGSNTGDGFVMATEIGAGTVGDSLLGYLGVDGIEGMWDDFSGVFHYGNGISLDVNTEAKRFCDESESNNVEFADVLQQPGDMAWGIVDGDNENAAVLETSASGYVYKADTIAELAELIHVDAAALQETIDTYNAAIANGEDTEFGTPIEMMDEIATAPFYAYVIKPIALSSLVGLTCNGNCEILDTEGNVIPNLYGAGDMIFGGNYLTYYVGGRGIGTALYTGRMAGENAKTAVLGE